jgi:hypothetical protein
MSQANLRNSSGNPYLYLEGTSGSVAAGINVGGGDLFNIVVASAASDIDPTSGNPSISIDPSSHGNITFSPQGTGESVFANGDVAISDGNLDLTSTAVSGTSGVVNVNGNRFISSYGLQNTFVGQSSGNFSLTSGVANGTTAVGYSSMIGLTTGDVNTSVGASSCGATTGSANCSVGYSSLHAVAAGSNNTAMGWFSLGSTTGSNNIGIGYNSGTQYTGTESSNILIGNTGTTSESNTIRIGTQGSSAGQQDACYIAGIVGSSVTSVGPVVISSSGQLGVGSGGGGGFTWSVITASTQTMASGHGYICNYSGTLILTLPTTSAVGDLLAVSGMNNATGWQISQNTGQQILFGVSSTTVSSGSIQSTNTYDSIQMVCNVANTSWIVYGSVGNLSIH